MKPKILVVDDEESVRKSFALAFEGTEFELDTAESGMSGVKAVEKKKYDLIYLDLKMPGLDGVDTLRQIRKLDKDVHIYILTAFHKEFFDKLANVLREGVRFELLEKPIGMDQIIHFTKGALQGPIAY